MLGGWFVDLYKCRWVVLVSLSICICIALIYIKLMDWFAVWMAWISVILIEVGLVTSGYFFYHYDHKYGSIGSWWAMFGLWTAAGLYCLCLLCCFKALRISIAVIETAADWFADTKRILFVPLFYFSFAILVFAAWACGIVMLSSISENPIVANGPGD